MFSFNKKQMSLILLVRDIVWRCCQRCIMGVFEIDSLFRIYDCNSMYLINLRCITFVVCLLFNYIVIVFFHVCLNIYHKDVLLLLYTYLIYSHKLELE